MRSPRFLVVVTACVLFCFGLAGCSTIQSETDEDAAACADYAVPDALRKKLTHEGSPLLLRVRTPRRHGSTRPDRWTSLLAATGWCVRVGGPGFVSTSIGI